jgi:CubicO group peptidase (beta-lactamase class C family)
MQPPLTQKSLTAYLEAVAGADVPGLQYVVVEADATLFEYAGGWADLERQQPMTPDTTLMAYSMTKTFTAIAMLQLVEQGRLGLDDEIDRYLPDTPYRGRHITIRQLLDHTAGLPNPIPLRWVHLTEEAAEFNEPAALAQVLADNPKLAFEPGQKYAYANIGYWLLGSILEVATGEPFVDYVRSNVVQPLGVPAAEMDFTIGDPTRHANGYLARWSGMNLFKGLVTDSQFWGGYEGNWLRLNSHHLNGPAFGGLVGTARAFSRLLQDQLRSESVLLGAEAEALLRTQQADNAGRPIPMTLGWHIGESDGVRYFYKEGGGGGFHAEMRWYPAQGIGSVVMVNATEFNSTAFLNRVDRAFLEEP